MFQSMKPPRKLKLGWLQTASSLCNALPDLKERVERRRVSFSVSFQNGHYWNSVHFYELTTDGSDEWCGRGGEVLLYQLVRIRRYTYVFLHRNKNKTSFMAIVEYLMPLIFSMINMAVTGTVSAAHKMGHSLVCSLRPSYGTKRVRV